MRGKGGERIQQITLFTKLALWLGAVWELCSDGCAALDLYLSIAWTSAPSVSEFSSFLCLFNLCSRFAGWNDAKQTESVRWGSVWLKSESNMEAITYDSFCSGEFTWFCVLTEVMWLYKCSLYSQKMFLLDGVFKKLLRRAFFLFAFFKYIFILLHFIKIAFFSTNQTQ